jgi:hypothetical protein
MEAARGADGVNDTEATVRRVREKLSWMQGIVQEEVAHNVLDDGGDSADARDVDFATAPVASGSA